MGARAQVKIKDNGVYLYTHWGSSRVLSDVRAAILRGERFNNPDYFTRIVFDQMTKGEHGSTTGAGIGTSPIGALDIFVELDCNMRIVSVKDFGLDQQTNFTFDEFVDYEFDDDEFVDM